MRTKFVIFGHEIKIRPERDAKLHFTDYIKKDLPEESQWKYDFNMEKRINAMVEHHRIIEYLFRDFGFALIVYRESALILLEDAMKSLVKIRSRLALKGATDEDLNRFDLKVHSCFQGTINVIKDRINDPRNENKEADRELLAILESFKIYEYHKC